MVQTLEHRRNRRSIRKLAGLFSVLVAALAMSTPATAQVDRTPFYGEDYIAGAPLDEGTQWVTDGGILHIRGLTIPYTTVGDSSYFRGESILVINMNQDLATGMGNMWGTVDLTLAEFEGGFTGTWTAKFTGLTGEDVVTWVGIGRAHGYGEVEGYQQRYTLTGYDGYDTVDGFWFSPGNK